MKKIIKRVLASILSIAILMTQCNIVYIYSAQENITVEVEQGKENSRKLTFSFEDSNVIKTQIVLNDEVLQEKALEKSNFFDVYTNGTFIIRGIDKDGAVVASVQQVIKDFEEITLIENKSSHTVEILSRIGKSAYADIEGVIQNNVSFTKENGLYKGRFLAQKNGAYNVAVYDVNETLLGTKEIIINSNNVVTEDGAIEIQNATDFEKIIQDPNGNYVLMNDIEITKDTLSDVSFTGTLDGNGYSVKGTNQRTFKKLDGATIKNITIYGGILAQSSTNTSIINSGFYILFEDTQENAALLLESENTTIEGSFVLANIKANIASGFVIEGTAKIKDSYVSGYVNGKEVYGFGKDVEVHNSYLSASLIGEERVVFTNGNQSNNFYDIQINDLEDDKARMYTTKELIKGDLKLEHFVEEKGYYPQIKAAIDMKEEAKKLSMLSAEYVLTDSHLRALEEGVQVVEKDSITWDSDDVTFTGNQANLLNEEGEIVAKSDDALNRFSLKQVRAIRAITAGESSTEDATQITYPTEIGAYYKIAQIAESITYPRNHKEAIENGWKIVYWSGVNRETQLLWNTSYAVYSTKDLKTFQKEEITTNRRTIDGELVLEGTYAIGEEMSAKLQGVNEDVTGRIYWEYASTLNDTNWTPIANFELTASSSSKITIDENQYFKYVRARFVVDESKTNYQGELTVKTDSIIKKPIEDVIVKNASPAIQGQISVQDKLYATIKPTGADSEVTYKWYQISPDGTEKEVGDGKNYTVLSQDVGNRIYVVATAKATGDLSGNKKSDVSDNVEAIKFKVPAVNQLSIPSSEDTTMTLSFTGDGLFAIRYKVKGTENVQLVDASVRGGTSITIVGLEADTTYQFAFKRVGENGCIDSDWTAYDVEGKTQLKNVQGDVLISGDVIFGHELTATIEDGVTDQTGGFEWYRLDEDGKRDGSSIGSGNTYVLKVDDINHKIEAVFKGNISFSGEISMISDRVKHEKTDKPDINVTIKMSETTDTSVKITMPDNSMNRSYNLGYSELKDGIPKVFKKDGKPIAYTKDTSYEISSLQRDTTYYFFIRYAETSTHEKSEWVDYNQEAKETTKRTIFNNTIEFTYDTTDATLMGGQRLIAKVKNAQKDLFTYNGEWKWVRVEGGEKKEVFDYELSADKTYTFYEVPTKETVGVKYEVSYTVNTGYTGTQMSTSNAVEAFKKKKYEAPNKQDIEVKTLNDSELTVTLKEGPGRYKFRYKKNVTTFSEDVLDFFGIDNGYTEVENSYHSNVDITISNLDRNSGFIVEACRIEDDGGSESDWSASTTSVSTAKTDISGSVKISGVIRIDETLTASYESASYAPSGDDTGGSWKWYRDETEITGQTSPTYKLTNNDVGKHIMAKYITPQDSDFSGNAVAITDIINKAVSENPTLTIEKSDQKADDSMYLSIKNASISDTNQSVYYYIQKTELPAPNYPTKEELGTIWKKIATKDFTIEIDSLGQAIASNGDYTVYAIKSESPYIEASGIARFTTKVGMPKQTGTISLTTGNVVVGKTIEAKLSDNANNKKKGKWKWYRSLAHRDTQTTVPAISDPSKWIEIDGGYSPSRDSASSTLNLTADLWGYYLYAEWTASEEDGYTGTIRSSDAKYVKRILEETLTYTTNTQDGYGNNKVYQGSVMTATLNNCYETGDINTNRKTTQFRVGNSTYDITNNFYDGNKMWRSSISENIGSGGGVVRAIVTMPKRYYLYTNDSLIDYSDDSLLIDSNISTNTSAILAQGASIKNSTDLKQFMLQQGDYTDRTKEYVIAANIKMSDADALALSQYQNLTPFSGILNGDFHTITNLRNMMFYNITGTASKYAEIKNLIAYNADIQMSIGSRIATGLFASIGSYMRFDQVFLMDSYLEGSYNTGYFVGRPTGGVEVLNSGSAGGTCTVNYTGASFGGIIGYIGAGVDVQNTFKNINTLGTDLNPVNNAIPNDNGGIVGGMNQTSVFTNVYTTNDVAITNALGQPSTKTGTIAGTNSATYASFTNAYYNWDTIKNKSFNFAFKNGTESTTKGMIGTKLQSAFNSASPNAWTYRSGYYPTLNWVKDHPIVNMYTATTGAFTSIDGKTTQAQLESGTINGAISTPQALQTKDYIIKSSNENVLKVVNNTIVPVGSIGQSADITVIYTQPDPTIGGSAKNTYTFTVANKMSTFTSTKIDGEATYGATLSASTEGAVASSYQWYRRKGEGGTPEKISGATNRSYTLKIQDIGYQFSVLVGGNNVASVMSSYTNTTIAKTPTDAPIITNVTDGSVVMSQEGLSGATYEFAYANSSTPDNKIMLLGTYKDGIKITIDKLSRNTSYNFYARVAGEKNLYDPSSWGPAATQTTAQTEVSGNVILGSAINNKTTITMFMEALNGQTGTWTLDRMSEDGHTVIESIPFSSNNLSTSYTFTSDDVGKRIRVTFTGTGNFKGSKSKLTEVVKKSVGSIPDKTKFKSSSIDESTVRVKLESVGTYDFAYSTSRNGSKTITLSSVEGNTEHNMTSLAYNSTYYIFARASANAGEEASDWTDPIEVQTPKCKVSEELAITGANKTAGDIVFTASDVQNQVGTWKLERISTKEDGTISSSTISSKLYTVSDDTRVLTYRLTPNDASTGSIKNMIKATFTGIQDYTSSISNTSEKILKENLKSDGLDALQVELVKQKDNELHVKSLDGTDLYQFGVAIQGQDTITDIDAVVEANREVIIDSLTRNTAYDIYIRKAALTGYNASDYVKVLTESTDRTTLTGDISYTVKNGDNDSVDKKVGTAYLGFTYTVNYTTGSYIPEGNDDKGHWKWYADGVEIPGAITSTYKVSTMVGNPEITARYIADDSSDFKGYREISIGKLTKPTYVAPKAPVIEALTENKQIDSELKISSDEIDHVYWFIQKSDVDALPTLVPTKDASTEEKENVWFKAKSNTKVTLDPNTEYVVYAARLEDGEYNASAISSQRAAKTVKDNLKEIGANITEADTKAIWKVLQAKELRVVCGDKATDGAWQYYVKAPSADAKWNNINSEVKKLTVEGKTSIYAYTKVQIPLKYLGYYVKVEYRGIDDYTGVIEYQGDEALVGTMLKGSAQIENANLEYSALSTIKASYVCPDGVTMDDPNGTWTWYREESDGNYQKIDRGFDKIGISDTYEVTSKDVDKRIYAIYSASTNGEFTGEAKTSVINNITRADQNKPTNLTLRQVSGNNVQVNLPTNYIQNGTTIPEVVLGYKKTSEASIQWIDDANDETWLKNVLAANSQYSIYAKFTRTSEFKESEASDALVVMTDNKSFEQKKLTVEANSKLYPSSKVKATFTGIGYDEGHYVIKRSDGEVITTLNGTLDAEDKKNSVTYTCTSDDIGANIVISYEANAQAPNYGGEISKATKVVQKPVSTIKPLKPELLPVIYEETRLQVKVNSAYEYVLSETGKLEDITAGQWQKYEANTSGNYTFTDLDETKMYYLFARVAETQAQQASEAVVSENIQLWKTTSYAITYDLNGGTNHKDNPTSYTELEEYTLIAPTKEGYSFTGWTFENNTIPNKTVAITKYSDGVKEFKANWKINTYNVTYHSNGDNETPGVKTEFNSKLSEPEKPTKIGYTFKGWYADSTFDTPWDFDSDTQPASDINLYAKWSLNQYIITFDSQGGTTIGSVEKDYDTELGALPEPSRSGYDFIGWFTKAVDGSIIDEHQKVLDKNAKYYARWMVISYDITIDIKGGEYASGIVQQPTYTIEDADIDIKEPIKEGYVFTGWTYDGQNVPKKDVCIAKGSAGNKAFVANWKTISYSVTYELNHGTNATSNPKSYTKEDQDIILKAPNRVGYAFDGWTPSDKIDSGSTGDKAFEAKWKVADSKVKFDSQGGSTITDMEATQRDIIYEPNVPSKTGYTFTGWYKEASCVNKWNFETDTVSTSSLTLYAGWEVTEFIVHFKDASNASNDVDRMYTYASDIGSKAPTFTRLGYTLAGWINDKGNKVSLTDSVYESSTLTAVWKLDVYDIGYVLNGGINHKDNPNSYTIESNKIELKDPYKSGSVFTGWAPNDKIETGSTGKYAFTAEWETAAFNVTFISNGGSEILPLGAKANSTIVAPNRPTRQGYSFDKWYKNKECTSIWDFDSDVVTSNTTLFAKWTINQYDVQFDAKNGISLPTVQKEYNATLGSLPIVSKTGYVFAGWYDENGTKALSSTVIKKASTFTAKWTLEVYEISYVLDEGVNHKDNPKTYTIEDDEILLKNPTKTGYVFDGWTPTNHIPANSSGDQRFHAAWKKANAKVTFDSQDGTSVSDVYVLQGYTMEEPESPTRVGYSFAGWYLDDECKVKWNFSGDIITKDVKLFAAWNQNIYKAEFVTIPNGSVENEIVNTYGKSLGALPTVTRKGYEFTGWYTEQTGGSAINSSTTITSNVIYYAHWSAKQYKITYDLDGGINHHENFNYYTIESDRIALKAPTNNTMAFTGWSYEGQVSPVKDVIIPKGSTGDVTYKANWKISDWQVSFDTMGGNTILNQYVSNNSYVMRPDTPSKEGNTFVGWYKEDTYNTVWNFTSDMVSANTKLYAKWNKNTYKVQFDVQGGSQVENIQRLYDNKIGNLPTPTKTGYTFAGWYSKDNKINENTLVKEDITYKAKWVAKEYAVTYILKNGINHKDNVNSYTIESDDITLLAPTKKDYAFLGWTYEGQDTPVKTVTIIKGSSGEKLFESVWKISDVKVDFNSNGGTKVEPYYGLKNDMVPSPMQPTKEGYSFKGWYKENTFITQWDFTTNSVDENITLYAKWEINQYTATFDVNGGKVLENNAIEKDYNQALGTLPTPVRSGYSFEGWYNKAVGGNIISSETKMLAKDVVYYAHWKLIEYQISYVLEDGENSSRNPSFYTVESDDIFLEEPLKAHYQFEGWTWKDQSNPTKVVVIKKGTTGEKAYQAHWSRSEFNVQFNSTGGSKVESRIERKGQLIKKPAKPVRIGYTFVGWYKEEQNINVWDFEKDRITDDLILYAQWSLNEYQVVYDVQGGNKINNKQGIHWNDKNLLPDSRPTKEGYQFEAWIDVQGNRVTSDTMYRDIAKQDDIKSITLQAVWQKIETPITPVPKPNPVVPIISTNPVAKPTPTLENKKDLVLTETTEEEIVVEPGVKRLPEAKANGVLKEGVIQLEKTAQTNNGNGLTVISIGKGKLNVNISYNVEIKDVEFFINAVLTTKQKEGIAAGSNIEIRMNVKEVNAKDNKDIALIKSKAKEKNLELGNFFDVSITIKEDDLPWMKVEELQEGVEITLPIEEKLQGIKANFFAIRTHKGESLILKDEDQKKETVTVKTSLFSTYAIAYKLKTSKEGISMTTYYITAAGAIIVVGAIFYLRKKQKRA